MENFYDSSVWHRPLNQWNHTYMMTQIRAERGNKVNAEFLNISANGIQGTVDNLLSWLEDKNANCIIP